MLSPKLRNIFLKFRTTNHHLPVEIGRWHGAPLCEILCTLCKNVQIAIEFHYILECKTLIDGRKDYLGKYYTQRPNDIKFKEIMSTQKEKVLESSVWFGFF